MNKRVLPIAFLLLLLCGMSFGQRKPAPNLEAAVTGSWHVDVDMFTFKGHTWAEERKNAKSIPPDVKAAIDQMRKTHITFKADHTYVATGSADGVHKGTWSMKGRDVISHRDGQKKQVVTHLDPDGRLRLTISADATQFLVKDGKSR